MDSADHHAPDVGSAHRWWPFRRSVGTPRPAAPSLDPSAVATESDLLGALDAIARMLRLFGEVPMLPDQPDVSAVRLACETWARHVLTLAPAPGGRIASGRDWQSLIRFVVERRHLEQGLVATSLADLRRAVLTIAEAIGGTIASDRTDGEALQDVVTHLQGAAASDSLEHLRGQVHHATEQLLTLAVQRDVRHQALAQQLAQLFNQVQILAAELREAQSASTTDALTGLYNRGGFDAAVRRSLSLRARTGISVSLALVDLDDLKWVNDTHGHGVGDAALCAVADCLRAACRKSDELARLGGDEFAVILIEAGAEHGERIAQRFLNELWARNLPVADGELIHVSASVGIAEANANDGPRSWLDRADRCLYRAKSLGKNRVYIDATPPPT